MLQDFYMLELYFGESESVISMEQLVKKYGLSKVQKYIADGLIQHQSWPCAAKKGAFLCWLTEKGRSVIAQTQNALVSEAARSRAI